MKSKLLNALSRLKPTHKEVMGVGISIILFFTISLIVNYFRNEPLGIWGNGGSQSHVSDTNDGKKGKWTSCDLDKVKSLMATGNVLMVDARPDLFYKFGHIPGAVSLPAQSEKSSKEARKVLSGVPKPRAIAVYCADSDCKNAETVASEISLIGYDDVYVFTGGWQEWTDSGGKVEKQ
jgi:rhodanese-related sulfurtransferase